MVTAKELMAKKQVKEASKIKPLIRVKKVWVCSKCEKEYLRIPDKCACSTDLPEMEERLIKTPKNLPVRIYEVQDNIIWESETIPRGTLVLMLKKDAITENLKARKLLSFVRRPEKHEIPV